MALRLSSRFGWFMVLMKVKFHDIVSCFMVKLSWMKLLPYQEECFFFLLLVFVMQKKRVCDAFCLPAVLQLQPCSLSSILTFLRYSLPIK